MPLQSSAILKNTGPKQDVKYWMWNDIEPAGSGGVGVSHDPTTKEAYFLKYSALSKVATDGRLLWTRSNPSGLAYGISSDSAGNVYTISGEVVVTKYNPAGNVVWAKSINTNGSSGPDVTVAPSGTVYGATRDSSGNAVLFKLNSDGSMNWARKISGVTSGFRSVAVDEVNDRVYAAGWTQPSEGITEGNLVALNLSGTAQWSKRFGVSENTSITFAYSTAVDFYGSSVYVTFRFGINGHCPIFRYSTNGALQDIDGSGVYGLWGYDEQFGQANFKINQANGDMAITYRSGSIRKYSIQGSALAGGRFLSHNGWAADIDSEGDMYFMLYQNNSGSLAAKVKSDASGTGTYNKTFSASASSGHYLDNSMQAWEAAASYSIVSTSLTSTTTSHSGVTTNPVANFAPLRTK